MEIKIHDLTIPAILNITTIACANLWLSLNILRKIRMTGASVETCAVRGIHQNTIQLEAFSKEQQYLISKENITRNSEENFAYL